MKTITVKLPDALAAWLSRRARELGRSQSELVRDSLERAAESIGGQNCHDLLQDVCGSVESPKDLSTNPGHLKRFGE